MGRLKRDESSQVDFRPSKMRISINQKHDGSPMISDMVCRAPMGAEHS
jgi:hypothetical protein